MSQISGQGTVALYGSVDGTTNGIFSASVGSAPTPIATTASTFPAFGLPSISGTGIFAFSASLKAGGQAIYTGRNAASLSPQVISSSALNTFGNVSVNNLGEVVFSADDVSGRFGIYVSVGGVISKVVARDGNLFGSTVTGLGLSQEAVNDSGEVSFSYSLADGINGIAIANIPEADASSLILASSVLFFGCKRRR